MRNAIYFHIYRGEKQFIAEAVGFPIITQGKTLDMLAKNVREVVELFLETKQAKNELKTKKPSVFMNFDLVDLYAKA